MTRTDHTNKQAVQPPASRLRTAISTYPATLFLGGHYLIFGFLPAIINESAELGFIAVITLIAGLCSFAMESLLRLSAKGNKKKGWLPCGPQQPIWRDQGNASTCIIWLVGMAATIASSIGGPSYATQVGAATVAGWASLASPFAVWAILGVGLIINQVLCGKLQPRTGYILILATCVVMLLLDIRSGMINRTVATLFAILVSLFLVGAVRPVVLVVVPLLALSAWPLLEQVRNDNRADIIGQVEIRETGFERIQLDRQLGNAPILRNAQERLDLPSFGLLVRTGLVPSFIDDDRPPLDVGSQFSVALGGSDASSTSTTVLGNVYVISGFFGVGIFAVLVSWLYQICLRRNNGFGIAGFILVYVYFTSFSSSYPTAIPGILQAGVSMSVAALIILLLKQRPVLENSRSRTPDSRPG